MSTEAVMDEIAEIREALTFYTEIEVVDPGRGALEALGRLEAREAQLALDREYWKGVAMQFHDAVHAEIERRAKVEI